MRALVSIILFPIETALLVVLALLLRTAETFDD